MRQSTTSERAPNRPPPQVILNADDFGRSTEINQAVIRAHREGVLTSASLMVTGAAFDEAVQLARETPTLAVGLHLVVIDGRPVLPPADIPHLVDRQGSFSRNAVRAGLKYFWRREARAELAREIEAQFARFAATGLPLSHVDGHCHLHLHPTVFNCLLPLAVRYGARGIRIPHDDFWLAVRCDARRLGTKAVWALTFAALTRWCRGRLRKFPLRQVDRSYGLMQSGCMDASYVVAVLGRLRVPTAELYFHPTTGARTDPLGPNPEEFATLLSPEVRTVLLDRGLQLKTYCALEQELGADVV